MSRGVLESPDVINPGNVELKTMDGLSEISEAVMDEENQPLTMSGLLIKNISKDTSENRLITTLGTTDTEYLKALCSCKIGVNREDDIRYAIVIAPSNVTAEMLKLNGIVLDNETIEISSTPLEFFDFNTQVPGTELNGETDESNNIVEFIAKSTREDHALFQCVILSKDIISEENRVNIRAVIATAVQFDKPNNEFWHRINGQQFYDLVNKKFKDSQNMGVSIRKKEIMKSPNLVDETSFSVITKEIRNYSMNVCKMMKRKLLYIDKKHFEIRKDKGSTGREQLYIDCSTSIYEYLRFYLVETLKDKMNCTEDLNKRRIASDDNIGKRSEVEAQYSLQFEHSNVKHNVHLTFYYTKCSLWVQGNSSKIDNLTIAQFFTYNYIEKVAIEAEKTFPLETIGQELRERITSFLSEQDCHNLINTGQYTVQDNKCVTCPRKCSDNDKSMSCISCSRKQHFKCANIRSEDERQLFLSGEEVFTCNECIQSQADEISSVTRKNTITVPPAHSSPTLASVEREIEDNIQHVVVTNEPNETVVEPNNDESLKKPEENHEIKGTDQSNQILIRRLREQISRMKDEYALKETQLNEEISNLKEAYRRCLAECEKERDTKETLKKCVDALQKQAEGPERGNANIDRFPDATNSQGDKKSSKICSFYNRKNGCRNGDNCHFTHKSMQPCRNGRSCNRRNCPFDHKSSNSESLQEEQDQKVSSTPCNFFNRKNGCRNGGNCMFRHVKMSTCPNLTTCSGYNCKFNHWTLFLGEKGKSNKPPDLMQNWQLIMQKQVEQEVMKNLLLVQKTWEPTSMKEINNKLPNQSPKQPNQPPNMTATKQYYREQPYQLPQQQQQQISSDNNTYIHQQPPQQHYQQIQQQQKQYQQPQQWPGHHQSRQQFSQQHQQPEPQIQQNQYPLMQQYQQQQTETKKLFQKQQNQQQQTNQYSNLATVSYPTMFQNQYPMYTQVTA